MGVNKKSLAKVFGPAVLLTAALALPIESLAAQAPGLAAVKVDQDDKDKKKNQKKVNPGQARKQQVQAQKQQVRQQQVQAQRQQQIAAQRQAELQRQRDLQIARERAAQQRAYDTRYTQNRNRGRGGADRSVIAADGILEDNGRCLILRGHQGQVYNLVGGTGGLREGEHVRLLGRLQYDRDSCGERLDVYEVQAIWADRNHRQTYFDHKRDGSFNNSYRERYADRYYDNYDDDYRYDDYDRRDRDDSGRLLAREGRLYNTRSACPVLETSDGDYTLAGDLRNYRDGDRVRVTGVFQDDRRCGDSIRIGEIQRR
ncbi:MAG TPA: hypothetical protein VHN15_02510 [Thermoanaerobaculia bacterium]|nr:hypothetical protein [Thermoanaerobaculia bacterium]